MAGKLRKGKKRWISIVGPREFRNNILGESYVIDPDMLIGKKVKLNLSNPLTGEPLHSIVEITNTIHFEML